MKVTVSFNTVKIVVPCGDGEKTVRELTQLATIRYSFSGSEEVLRFKLLILLLVSFFAAGQTNKQTNLQIFIHNLS